MLQIVLRGPLEEKRDTTMLVGLIESEEFELLRQVIHAAIPVHRIAARQDQGRNLANVTHQSADFSNHERLAAADALRAHLRSAGWDAAEIDGWFSPPAGD